MKNLTIHGLLSKISVYNNEKLQLLEGQILMVKMIDLCTPN